MNNPRLWTTVCTHLLIKTPEGLKIGRNKGKNVLCAVGTLHFQLCS
jgi:hypothetical protein